MMTAIQNETSTRPVGSPTERPLCICAGLTATELAGSIRRRELTSVAAVMNTTGAGTGCFGCWEDIDALIARAAEAPQPRPTLSAAARQLLVRAVIEDEIRPALKRRGADIELRELDGSRVRVRLSGVPAGGRPADLPGNLIGGFTPRGLAEGLLRELVGDDLVLETDR